MRPAALCILLFLSFHLLADLAFAAAADKGQAADDEDRAAAAAADNGAEAETEADKERLERYEAKKAEAALRRASPDFDPEEDRAAGGNCEIGPFGGPGGYRPFSDAQNSAKGPITAVRIYAGWRVDSIQVKYGDTWAPERGGWGGALQEFTLQQGEKIVAVSGKHMGDEDSVDQLVFKTNKGKTYGPFGTVPKDHGEIPFNLALSPSCYLKYISGTELPELMRIYFMFDCN